MDARNSSGTPFQANFRSFSTLIIEMEIQPARTQINRRLLQNRLKPIHLGNLAVQNFDLTRRELVSGFRLCENVIKWRIFMHTLMMLVDTFCRRSLKCIVQGLLLKYHWNALNGFVSFGR